MKLLLIANEKNPQTVDALYQIVAFCEMNGIGHVEMDVRSLPDSEFTFSDAQPSDIDERLAEPIDLVITLGGDGTLLHSTRLSVVLGAPIAGINFGHLGFLTNSAENGVIALLADLLSGEVVQEERVNLMVEVTCEGDEDGQAPRRFFAMNEIAVARGGTGSIVDFDYSISGDHIAHMRGDGLIIATATGSTAYALSAGGPLVGPRFRGMIVAPLAAHTLNARPIVAERNDVVEVELPTGEDANEVSLFADGDALEFDSQVKTVRVTVGPHPAIILSCRSESFYKQIARTFFDK